MADNIDIKLINSDVQLNVSALGINSGYIATLYNEIGPQELRNLPDLLRKLYTALPNYIRDPLWPNYITRCLEVLTQEDPHLYLPCSKFDAVFNLAHFLEAPIIVTALRETMVCQNLCNAGYFYRAATRFYGTDSPDVDNLRNLINNECIQKLSLPIPIIHLQNPRAFAHFVRGRSRTHTNYVAHKCIECKQQITPMHRFDEIPPPNSYQMLPCCSAPIHLNICLRRFYNTALFCKACYAFINPQTGDLDLEIPTYGVQESLRYKIRSVNRISGNQKLPPLPLRQDVCPPPPPREVCKKQKLNFEIFPSK